MLHDMAEVDALIFELSDLQRAYAENAAEKLIQTCCRSSEAFQYLQLGYATSRYRSGPGITSI